MKSKWSQDVYIKAFMFAAEVHKDQKVPGSDLPYIVHLALVSMEVMAALSVEDGLDGDLAVQCALLHDVIEDAKVTREKVEAKFTSAVADGVWALTKDDEVGSDIDDEWEQKKLRMADSLNRINQQPEEIWKEIGMVKMADRITNLQPPPSHWTDEKIAYYKQEAILIYNELKDASPFLAERLKSKIEGYNEKKDPELKRTFST
jgi:(p)ppGpp synthase/HD superfamily hydrolase